MTMREPPSSSAASSGMGQNPRPASTGPSAAGGGAQPGGPGVPPNQDDAGSGGVREQIGEQVGPAAEKVQEKAGQAFGQVRQQMTSQLDSQKDKAAEGLTQAADAVRKTTEQLRKQEQMSAVANYAEDAAETIERLAGFLRERDMSQLMSETERFARQRPTMFLASAFTLGLVAARFLKSSPPQTNGAGYGSGQAPYQLSSPSYSPPSPPPAPVTRPPASTATPPTTSNPVTGVGAVSTGSQPQTTPNRPNTGQVPPLSGGV